MTAAKLNRIDPEDLSSNPRATLAAWQRYEDLIIQAFQAHPQGWTYTPRMLAPVTFVSRIRDAIRGKIAFDYPSIVNKEEIANWFSQVIFKVVGNDVYIGPKTKLMETLKAPTTTKDTLTFETLSIDEICAFALLLSGGQIQGPIVIQKPPSISSLPNYPNFHTLPRPDGSLVLL